MTAEPEKIVAALKQLYDVVAAQQQQLDLIAQAALGIPPEELYRCEALAKAELEIEQLQRIFNQPADGKEDR
jgi:hypothetical protein